MFKLLLEMTEAQGHIDQNRSLKRFLSVSFAIHVLFLIYLAIKGLVFPDQPTEYLPSLRVDLVALPDQKKTEIVEPKPAEPEKPVETPKVEPQAKPDIKPEADDGDFAVKKKKKKAEHAKKEKAAQKKLKAALDRIRAIERVKALAGGDEVKGNKISKGSALSGEAKTALETTYFDVVLERVRTNWELPKWLQDQNLAAKVAVYIDSRGQMKSFRFIQSSGNKQFDDEVKKTLQASSPYPIPPEAIGSELSSTGVILGFPL